MKNRITLCISVLLVLLIAADASAADRSRKKRKKTRTDTVLVIVRDTVHVNDTVFVPYDYMMNTQGEGAGSVSGAAVGTCGDGQYAGDAGKSAAGAGKPVVRPGIEVLERMGFAPLKGKRVGLVTNPSGVDRNLRSTIDILYNADGVELVALFGPEHGVRGNVYDLAPTSWMS